MLALLLVACGLVSRDEVSVVPSPDRRLEAVLIETNGGATTSFGYEIWVREKGQGSGNQVARLYAAARNDVAYGASLRWADDGHLLIEFQEARTQTLDTPTVRIGGREVRVALRPNVPDPEAPAGGMLFNLERELTTSRCLYAVIGYAHAWTLISRECKVCELTGVLRFDSFKSSSVATDRHSASLASKP
jgi:hypothetical protein